MTPSKLITPPRPTERVLESPDELGLETFIPFHFPFHVHEIENHSSDDLSLHDLSGKFWISVNYTIPSGHFDM